MIILAFKISILNFTPLKMVTSIYIYCKQCILTKFTTKKLLLFEFQVWASVVAFLAFSTLKFQTNAKTSLKPSSKHIHAKKILKSDISLCLAFDLAFPTFIGLFHFFLWSLNYNKSSIEEQWHKWPFYHLKELLLKNSLFGSLWWPDGPAVLSRYLWRPSWEFKLFCYPDSIPLLPTCRHLN